MDNKTIVAKALTRGQYEALQHPSLKIPSSNELFEFQLETFKECELTITNEEIAKLRRFVPEEQGFFLVVPTRPRNADFTYVFRRIAKKAINVQGHLDPRMDLLENLQDEGELPSEPHILLRCNDGQGAIQKNATGRASYFHNMQRTPYTFWQALVHLMVYPMLLHDFQVMAMGTIGKSDQTKKKWSPVIQTTTGSLQIVMRSWDDAVANCLVPSYESAVPKKEKKKSEEQ
ncbi:MAG TPA: hypothetical protein VLG69_04225 [Candidatus Andersenbacteria bacterium]|nr:hypothetical protein [Candidatus Andersenbacteria bacterium]